MKKFLVSYRINGLKRSTVCSADNSSQLRERLNCSYPEWFILEIKEG